MTISLPLCHNMHLLWMGLTAIVVVLHREYSEDKCKYIEHTLLSSVKFRKAGCTYLLRAISTGGCDPDASVPSVSSLDLEGPGAGGGPVGGGPAGGWPVGRPVGGGPVGGGLVELSSGLSAMLS